METISPEAQANQHRARCVALRKQGDLAGALREIQAALKLRPDYPEGYFNLAAIYFEQDRLQEAIGAWRHAAILRPTYWQAYVSLSNALRRMGRIKEAVAAAQQAINIKPDDAEPFQAMATALAAAHQHDAARKAYERALQINPKSVVAHNNYANLLADMDRPAEAAQHFEAALAIDPRRVEVMNNLANVLKAQGRIDEAITKFREVIARQPKLWNVHSNLLLTLNSHPSADNGLHGEHAAWAVQHVANIAPWHPTFANAKEPRKLRIGYVSADMRKHSVSYFLEPILTHHDREQFEIYAYSNTDKQDSTTKRLAALCNQFRPIFGHTHESVAGQIRTDGVDILIDLNGHTANHRLLSFARKPAPVQATYLGYPNTTGLSTMDYRITDAVADPPGMTESHHSEQLIRLPGCFLCYGGPGIDVPLTDVLTVDEENIVFGTFNNFAKVTDEMLALWCQILDTVDGSTLIVKAETLGDPKTRGDVCERINDLGGDASRITLMGREPRTDKHLEMYNRVDIGLDTFPYHGTTTTCEALWMGVPVITMVGKAHVSRVGGTILTHAGLPELIANDPDEYVQIAADLAGDVDRLREIKANLRSRLQASPLMDAVSFTRNLEAAYRTMWQNWVATQ